MKYPPLKQSCECCIPNSAPYIKHLAISTVRSSAVVGRGIPLRHVLGLKAQVLTKSIVKVPRFVGAKLEVIIESQGCPPFFL